MKRLVCTLSATAYFHIIGSVLELLNWSNCSDVGAYANGLILVMVDGACSYCVNAALNAKDRYEDYFVQG
ncbi:MAG: hypothetical protein ABSE51_13580 [Terracidiphilus sp.]|jgi:hypothetical protein